MAHGQTSRWGALALLSVAQFMVVLDLAIVNVALPSIQADLGFSQGNLQWVVSAYAIALGGFVLLGGRAADLFGRRRVLTIGLATFAIGSLVSGLAWSDASLVAARGLQGLGAAMISPAALSLLTTTFREGRHRNVALGVWGAVGALGAAAGALVGGALTDTLGWEWVFFVNLPVVAAVVALAPVVLEESRDLRDRRFDLLGALLVTAGLSSAVFSISRVGELGLSSPQTLGGALASLALLVAFVVVEVRATDPLISFAVLRVRVVRGANLAGMLVTASVSPMFLMLTIYMQRVLDFSPIETGLAYLAITSTTVVWSTVASRLVSRIGPRPVLATGLGLIAVALTFFARAPQDGTYVRDLLPGFVLVATGMGLAFVALNVAALSGIAARDAGFGSGLLGTSQQIGAAFGIAILSSLAVPESDAGAGTTPATLTDGLHLAFHAGALIALAGVVATLVLLRRERPAVVEAADETVLTAA